MHTAPLRSSLRFVLLAVLSACGAAEDPSDPAGRPDLESALSPLDAELSDYPTLDEEDPPLAGASAYQDGPLESDPGTGSAPDPLLNQGHGPWGCPETLCGADREELPHGTLWFQTYQPDGGVLPVIPEPPRIARRLRMAAPVDDECTVGLFDAGTPDGGSLCQGKRLGPALPAYRTSTDGRIALTGPTDTASVSALQIDGDTADPLIQRGAGFDPFSTPVKIKRLPDPPERTPSGDRFFCGNFATPKADGQGRDCYELFLIEDWQHDSVCKSACAQFASIKVRICVANPKTTSARIDLAEAMGDSPAWTKGPQYPAHTNEQVVTADGKLVMFRLIGSGGEPGEEGGAGMPFRFRKKNGEPTQERIYSLAYSHSRTPCDVVEWFKQDPGTNIYSNLRPLSSVHHDPNLAGYGIHAYPLRDAFGDPFPEGSVVRGSYPWIDREGNNVMFSTILPKLTHQDDVRDVRRYTTKREYEFPNPAGVNRSPRGFALAGSWTQGKMVMLDNLLNNEDYGFDAGDTRRLALYRSAGGQRIDARADGNTNHRGYAGTLRERPNTQHLESLQNVFAMHQGLKPVTPRDVVWTFSRGDFLEEVAFDDMLDPFVLLLAPMNAAWSNEAPEAPNQDGPAGVRAGTYKDGFGAGNLHLPSTIQLQNAATSRTYPIARHGTVRVGEGSARVEPVANGGIEGRGLWLENNASLSFRFTGGALPFPETSVYAGLFVDVRKDLEDGRLLFSVKEADLTDSAAEIWWRVVMHQGGISVQRTSASAPSQIGSFPVSEVHPYRQSAEADGGWHHVGVLFQRDHRVTVLIDGDPIGTRTFPAPLTLRPGAEMTVGGAFRSYSGIWGWVDEARLVVSSPASAILPRGQLDSAESIELLCNYARGTMASLPEGDPRYDDAGRLSPRARARAAELRYSVGSNRLRCMTDYTRDHGVSVASLDTVSVREHILNYLSGGDAALLKAGQPRPDTRKNAFCRSCHVSVDLDDRRPTPLKVRALMPHRDGAHVEDDPRTQPSQPWARPGEKALAHGVIPRHWIRSVDGIDLPPGDQDHLRFPVLHWVLRRNPPVTSVEVNSTQTH